MNADALQSLAHAMLAKVRERLDPRWYTVKAADGFPLTVKTPDGQEQLTISIETHDAEPTYSVLRQRRSPDLGALPTEAPAAMNLPGDALVSRIQAFAESYCKARKATYYDRESWREHKAKIEREDYDAAAADQAAQLKRFVIVKERGHERAVPTQDPT